MNTNEMKIRGELERDVERDLEDEIKEGICQLALRLHRLYLHQEERNTKKSANDIGATDGTHGTNTKALSEVNINIKMEGGTKIEIKEIKKKARRSSSNLRSSKVANNMQKMNIRQPKFNWTQSLRSGPTPITGYTKIDSSSNRVKNIVNKSGQQNVKVAKVVGGKSLRSSK
ncbi:uncharacterized protein [Nicotiana tomentosiformis]|uniref:uncharacterized protein n=1 Tax=Nicotiana tomentosiformis TaxID=4098 RepID=UPI00051CA44B|nr:uncharacterized protein LOC104095004 [Nicotiana tomentosiformis]XP_009599325.1 uncharacterized protein LOC104095004 [Nicotiana tomentosiformis]XP_018625887.1 uncharacterized protein LOC104095004 [Nicotiana tomentosiformis]